MFIVPVPKEVRDYCWKLVNEHDFGKRGDFDGTKNQQYVGMIGQVMICDLLGLERPDGKSGFDGGYDIMLLKKKIDIKTMTRTVPIRESFVHNFVSFQRKFDVDFYLFNSYNKTNQDLTICGVVNKEAFFKLATHSPKGASIKRANGTEFELQADCHMIKQLDLYPVFEVDDISIMIQELSAEFSRRDPFAEI